MAAPEQLDPTTIDSLLERYLSILDEYTTLRDSLNALQSGIYQNIARANFSAERGIRYGQDHYDDRMQAKRRVHVKRGGGGNDAAADSVCPAGNHYALNVVVHAAGEARAAKSEGEEGDEKVQEGDEKGQESPVYRNSKQQEEEDEKSKEGNSKSSQDGKEEGKTNNKTLISKTDPLRWFGLLTPPALRQAQSQAIQAVDDIIPRLATVNMAMAEVELEIRRARKKRAKMEAASEKEKLRQSQGEGEQIHRYLGLSSAAAAAVDAL